MSKNERDRNQGKDNKEPWQRPAFVLTSVAVHHRYLRLRKVYIRIARRQVTELKNY